MKYELEKGKLCDRINLLTVEKPDGRNEGKA